MWTSTRAQFLYEFGRGNEVYMNFDDHFPSQKWQAHCIQLQMMLLELSPEFREFLEFAEIPEMESSRAVPTVGSTHARGHDDDS